MNEQYYYLLDGNEQGPFSQAAIVRLLQSGKLNGAFLRTSSEQPWQSPEELGIVIATALPISPPTDRFGFAMSANPAASEAENTSSERRTSLPYPPRLHWALVLLFGVLTFGIFMVVWYFIQSSYIRKLDKNSNATTYLAIGICAYLLSLFFSYHGNATGSSNAWITALLLSVTWIVLFYCALFSMAHSLRDLRSKYGVRMSVGGITLFFFSALYLQGQLTWLARWKETGQTEPDPPKGIFWGLFGGLIALCLAILILAVSTGLSSPYLRNIQSSGVASTAGGEYPANQPSVVPPDEVQPYQAERTGTTYSSAADSAMSAAMAAADAASAATSSNTDSAAIAADAVSSASSTNERSQDNHRSPYQLTDADAPDSIPGTDEQQTEPSANQELRLLSASAPIYPQEEHRRGITGTTTLILSVDRNGYVVDSEVEVSSGNENLDRAAFQSARRYVFSKSVNGSRVRMPIDFKLN